MECRYLGMILVTMVTGCGPGPSAAADPGTDTATTDEGTQTGGDGTESESESETESETETEAGIEDPCDRCERPTEIAEGIVECADGRLNRVASGTFDPTISASACMGDEDVMSCTSDADCNAGVYGKCIHTTAQVDFEEQTLCGCAYSCSIDDDCGAGSVCVPPGVLWGNPTDWPMCVPAVCATDSDCEECGECGMGKTLTFGDCADVYAIECRSADDLCRSDGGCKSGPCFPDPDGTWACDSVRCI